MNSLEEKLINAKKIMNKVESGNYTRGNINQEILFSSPEELGNTSTSPVVNVGEQNGTAMYKNKVQSSNLPDSIKQLMIEEPIHQPSMNVNTSSLDLNFVNKVAEKMEKMNLKEQPQQKAKGRPFSTEQPSQPMGLNEAVIRELKPLIVDIIESTIEKILEQKLKEMDSKTTKVNENLQLRVGDTVFTGKITGAKTLKK